jgi:hypothetical protein
MAESPEDISLVNEIERALDRQPFLPFVIVAASGDRYEVTGRHQVAVARQVIIILPPNATSVYLRTNQLVAVELAAPAA